MTKCIQCDNPAFQRNNKVYKLCAVCGLKAICNLFGWKYDEDTGLIAASKRVNDIVGLK